jgi:hypothetical protein
MQNGFSFNGNHDLQKKRLVKVIDDAHQLRGGAVSSDFITNTANRPNQRLFYEEMYSGLVDFQCLPPFRTASLTEFSIGR